MTSFLRHRWTLLLAILLALVAAILLVGRMQADRVSWTNAATGEETWTYVLGPDAEQWMKERMLESRRGLSSLRVNVPVEDGVEGSFRREDHGKIWNLDDSMATHLKVRGWLTETFGRDGWRLKYEPTVVLRVSCKGRLFGIFENQEWDYPGGSERPKVIGRKTTFTWPQVGPFKVLFVGQGIKLTSTNISYDGRSWPFVLLLVTPPILLVYALRRPVSRILRLRRERRT